MCAIVNILVISHPNHEEESMKRLLWVLLFFLVAAGLLLGAGPKITFWSMQQSAADLRTRQEKALKDFEAKNNVQVELTVFPYSELQDKLLTAMGAGQGPDVLLIDQIWVAQYATAGFIQALDNLVAGSSLKATDFFPGAWGAAHFQGKQYAVPFDVGVWALLYYNKDMFKAAGLDPEKPPVTWDDFYSVGKKLTKANQYGTAIWVGTGDAVQCVCDALVASNGGKVVDDSGKKSLLNQPPAVQAFDYYKKLNTISPPGTVGRSEEDSFKLFTAGQVAMFLYGEWGQDTIAVRAPNLNYGMGLFPRPANGKSIGTFGGWEMAINSKSQHKDAAWKLIASLGEAKVNQQVASLTPANVTAADVFLKANRKYPDVIYKQLTTALYRPLVPNYPAIAEVQRAATQQILLGQMATKAALDQAVQKIDQLLGK
jgi:ABC-type glycerol-3-phosphate transport system substrate-binding protein